MNECKASVWIKITQYMVHNMTYRVVSIVNQNIISVAHVYNYI